MAGFARQTLTGLVAPSTTDIATQNAAQSHLARSLWLRNTARFAEGNAMKPIVTAALAVGAFGLTFAVIMFWPGGGACG
jgi:hypothetical protein